MERPPAVTALAGGSKTTGNRALDFRGVYLTRAGALVRILAWNQARGCWVGKRLDGTGVQIDMSWDARGNHTNPDFNLMDRVTGYPLREIKFGLLKVK
ncbi:MAG: hypothetical protein ACLPWF_04710 [Bryobacteraceae bacterium]